MRLCFTENRGLSESKKDRAQGRTQESAEEWDRMGLTLRSWAVLRDCPLPDFTRSTNRRPREGKGLAQGHTAAGPGADLPACARAWARPPL